MLAEEVMGLRYDLLRTALKESESSTAQIQDVSIEEGQEDERALYLIYRRLFRESRFRLCDDPPLLLLWEQKFRENRHWLGEPEDLSEKIRNNAKKLMGDASQLRAWLRGMISKNALITGNLLGRYDPPSGRIELYPAILDALATLLGLPPRSLKNVVFIQLSVIAIAHQARDLDGQPGFSFAIASATNPFQKESPALIELSQYFTFRLIERLGDINLMGAFEKLSTKQPEPYRRWHRMRHMPLEQMRAVLLRARLVETALGLPYNESE